MYLNIPLLLKLDLSTLCKIYLGILLFDREYFFLAGVSFSRDDDTLDYTDSSTNQRNWIITMLSLIKGHCDIYESCFFLCF